MSRFKLCAYATAVLAVSVTPATVTAQQWAMTRLPAVRTVSHEEAPSKSRSDEPGILSREDLEELAQWARNNPSAGDLTTNDVEKLLEWSGSQTKPQRRYPTTASAPRPIAVGTLHHPQHQAKSDLHGELRLVSADDPFVDDEEAGDRTLQDPGLPVPTEEINGQDPGLLVGPGKKGKGGFWKACCGCLPSGVIGGAELTFLAPLDEPEQTVLFTDLTNDETHLGSTTTGLGTGARVWLGLETCHGWGFRARYWGMRDVHIDNDPTVPLKAQPAAFHESSELNLDVIDVEVTGKFCHHCWTFEAAFGGRYLDMERNHTIVGYGDVGNGVTLTGLAVGAHELRGSGFTFALGGHKPFKVCWMPCGWKWYWNYRGSLLWADSVASVLTEANAVTDQPAGFGQANSRDKAFAGKDHSEDVFINEIQLGLRYEKCCHHLPGAIFFFNAGLEYQHWETGDVFASSNSFAFFQGPGFGGRVDASATAHDGSLDLFGIVIGAGWSY